MTIPIHDDILIGVRVAVIDDEPDNLFVAQMLLETYGAEVVTAVDGIDGLRVIRETRPLFVVSDIGMPKMNGEAMVRELKQDAEIANIPVIALSAHAMLDDMDSAISAGFHNYLIKPLRPERFVSDLVNMLINIPEIAHALGVS